MTVIAPHSHSNSCTRSDTSNVRARRTRSQLGPSLAVIRPADRVDAYPQFIVPSLLLSSYLFFHVITSPFFAPRAWSWHGNSNMLSLAAHNATRTLWLTRPSTLSALRAASLYKEFTGLPTTRPESRRIQTTTKWRPVQVLDEYVPCRLFTSSVASTLASR